MNILPKKRWHVRTKENIARVRRDEAQAAEEEKQRQQRARLAEQEARTSLLRERAKRTRERDQETILNQDNEKTEVQERVEPLEHVNFFKDLEAGETTHTDNKEREKELKKEQEEYEKKIGLLTYLGQDTHELAGTSSWWEKLPQKRSIDAEKDEEEENSRSATKVARTKECLDPLNDIRKYLGCDGVKNYIEKSKRKDDHRSLKSPSSSRKSSKKAKKDKKKKSKKKKSKKKKKRRHTSSSSSESDEDDEEEFEAGKLEKQRKLEKLRMERLAREKRERAREMKILHPESAAIDEDRPHDEKAVKESKRKYNSQFNPEAARQNKLDPNKKYWLE